MHREEVREIERESEKVVQFHLLFYSMCLCLKLSMKWALRVCSSFLSCSMTPCVSHSTALSGYFAHHEIYLMKSI